MYRIAKLFREAGSEVTYGYKKSVNSHSARPSL